MNAKDITKAKDADLRSSLTALRRASTLARRSAVETNTSIVLVRDGRLIVVEADALREELRTTDAPRA